MGYYNNKGHFFSDEESLEHRAKYGTANSVTNEKGTDGKKNNSSQYNHDYYMKNKEKWKGTHSEYSKDDKDFDESNYSEKNRLGDTDFYGWQKEDGSWVILEEDMKFTIPAGMSRADIIKKLEAFDKEVEAKRNSGQNYTNEEWINGAKRALSSDSDEKEFDVEAAARDVIAGKYKNGAERKAALGDDYELVQKKVNELMKKGGGSGKKSNSSSSSSTEKKDGEPRTFSQVQSDYNKQKQNLSKEEATNLNKATNDKYKNRAEEEKKKKNNSLKQYFGEDGAIISYYDGRY